EGTSETASGACFVTAKAPITLNLPALGPVPLQDGQVIGRWEGDSIVDGRVRGFLPKSVAEATRLPAPVPPYLAAAGVTAGTPLTDFLSDRELAMNPDGVSGWVFLINFSASPATFDPD